MKHDFMELIKQTSENIPDNILTGMNKILIPVFGLSMTVKFIVVNWSEQLMLNHFLDIERLSFIAALTGAIGGILLLITNLIKLINSFYEGKLTGKWIKDFIKYIKKCKCL